MHKIFITLKEFFFADIINRYLIWSALVLSAIDYLIWHRYLSDPNIFIYIQNDLYPIKFLALLLGINTILAVFSFVKEKEMSYLFLIADIILALLTLSLEIFYLFSNQII